MPPIDPPDLAAIPKQCARCGEPVEQALYAWLVQTRSGVRAIGPPVSLHVVPRPGRTLEWIGLCANHRRRRVVHAFTIALIGWMFSLGLLAYALFVAAPQRAFGLTVTTIVAGFLVGFVSAFVAVWRMIVIPVSQAGGGGSSGGAGGLGVPSGSDR